jgi:hypothetical protein
MISAGRRWWPGADGGRARTVRGLTGLAALALLLAGCGQANPSVAAYVGSEKITDRQVETALEGVRTSLGPEQEVSKIAVVTVLVQGEIAAQIARDRNISLTDTQRNSLLAGSNLAPLLEVPEAKPVAYDIADTEIVSRALGESGYLAEIAKRPVKLNPRFGVLDPTQKTIIPNSSGSLSIPEPAEAGS